MHKGDVFMELSKSLAQMIVDKVMLEIPYNINIMNKDGIIIASGDDKRINEEHDGALKAVNIKKEQIVYSDSQSELSGVNTPFYFNGEIVGVIGITGNPMFVTSLAPLVKSIAELLLIQKNQINQEQKQTLRLESFLQQWARTTQYDTGFILESERMGIHIDDSYKAFIIKSEKEINFLLEKDEFLVKISIEHALLISNKKRTEQKLTKQFTEKKLTLLGIGEQNEVLSKSVNQALVTAKLNKIFGWQYSRYGEIRNIDQLLKSNLDLEEYTEKFKEEYATERGRMLIKTLKTYIRNNGNMNITSSELFIHRNTLKYRLEQIHECYGLDPKKYFDLIFLIISYYFFQYERKSYSEGE